MKRKYYKPAKLSMSRLVISEKKVESNGVNWSRYGYYLNKDGVVTITDYNWKFRDEVQSRTDMETVIHGMRYQMQLFESDLSDRSLMMYASHFVKYCFSQEFAKHIAPRLVDTVTVDKSEPNY